MARPMGAGIGAWLLLTMAVVAAVVPLATAAGEPAPAATATLAPAAGATAAPADATAQVPILDLAPHAGRVVYVDFWASWCAPCRMALPWLQDMQGSLGESGLTVLTVNLDRDRAAAEAFLAKYDLKLPVVWDPEGKLAAAHKLDGMPTALVFGRDGKLRDRHVGFGPGMKSELETKLRALLAEAAPSAAGQATAPATTGEVAHD